MRVDYPGKLKKKVNLIIRLWQKCFIIHSYQNWTFSLFLPENFRKLSSSQLIRIYEMGFNVKFWLTISQHIDIIFFLENTINHVFRIKLKFWKQNLGVFGCGCVKYVWLWCLCSGISIFLILWGVKQSVHFIYLAIFFLKTREKKKVDFLKKKKQTTTTKTTRATLLTWETVPINKDL